MLVFEVISALSRFLVCIGNNVSNGGQAGISGHLQIGNNVKIAGGKGVKNNIENNEYVMG